MSDCVSGAAGSSGDVAATENVVNVEGSCHRTPFPCSESLRQSAVRYEFIMAVIQVHGWIVSVAWRQGSAELGRSIHVYHIFFCRNVGRRFLGGRPGPPVALFSATD